jgi:hypothetical protein
LSTEDKSLPQARSLHSTKWMLPIASIARNNECSKPLHAGTTAAATLKKLYLSACRWLIE